MIFNVWNPSSQGADAVAFDITRANMPRAAKGDPDWIAACLRALGIEGSAREWSIQAARCHFYSDYADEPEWQDRWPDTWMVRVTLDRAAPTGFGAPDPIPIQVDQYDRSWSYGHVDPDHDRVALLLLLWRGSESDAMSARESLLASLPGTVDEAQTRLESAGPEWTRVRWVVRGELFPERVGSLEDVVRRARDQGFIVNRNELY